VLAIELLVAFLVGAFVAATDIGRDHPTTWSYALRTWGAWAYLFINGVFSLPAVAAIDALGWNFLLPANAERAILHGAIAGLGGMGLLRAEFVPATASAGAAERTGQAVWLRATKLMNFLMAQASQHITPSENLRIRRHADRVMRGVSFEKAQNVLPIQCLRLHGSLTERTSKELAVRVGALIQSGLPKQALVNQLGALLIEKVGARVLKRAILDFGGDITE